MSLHSRMEHLDTSWVSIGGSPMPPTTQTVNPPVSAHQSRTHASAPAGHTRYISPTTAAAPTMSAMIDAHPGRTRSTSADNIATRSTITQLAVPARRMNTTSEIPSA